MAKPLVYQFAVAQVAVLMSLLLPMAQLLMQKAHNAAAP
jgi:hypothetical protein